MDNEPEPSPPLSMWDGYDTIAEPNDPNFLDMTKHQVYLDTTRNYAKPKTPVKEIVLTELAIKHLRRTNIEHEPLKIKLNDFPRSFLTLRRFKEQFVFYDRCDASEPWILLLDTGLVMFQSHELEVASFDSLISFTDEGLELKLNSSVYYKNPETYLRIEKTKFEYVYKIEFESETWNWSRYATIREYSNYFDMVVNHCPGDRMREFQGFDRIDD